MPFKILTTTEAISKGFRENEDKQSGQHSVVLKDSTGKDISDTNPLPVSSEANLVINVQIDSVDSNIEYVGEAAIGSLTADAVWKIKKVDSTTGTIIKYADSNDNFDNVFDDRESFIYG